MNKKYSSLFIIIVFLLFPIFTLITAFNRLKDRFSYNIIWLFCTYIGLTFAIPHSSDNSDIVRYLEEFNSWKLDERTFGYLLNNVYTPDGYKDIFFPFISWVAAKMGFSNVIFLALLGFIFGYYYSRVFRLLCREIKLNHTFFLSVLLAAYLLIDPIWRGINGIRFSLAAIMYVYFILKIYREGFKLKYVLFISGLVLIHFSMVLPVGVFFLFNLIKNKLNLRVLLILFIVSFFFTAINLDTLNDELKKYVPKIFLGKVDEYARESYGDELADSFANVNWYAQFFYKSLFYASSIMLVYIYTRYKDLLRSNSRFSYIIKLSFVLSIIANLTSFIPSLGRMNIMSNMLILFVFVILINNFKHKAVRLLRMKVILSPLLLLYIVVQMRIGFDFLSVFTLFGNPVEAFFDFEKKPLINLIK